jgi:hypothetical protein
MLQKIEIVYKDQYYDVTLTVKQGTFADGIRRAALQGESLLAGPIEGMLENLSVLITQWIRPSCLAGLASVENRGEHEIKPEPTLEEFMEYPDALIELWQNTVWELNPHWSPFGTRPTQQNSLTENSLDGTPQKE